LGEAEPQDWQAKTVVTRVAMAQEAGKRKTENGKGQPRARGIGMLGPSFSVLRFPFPGPALTA
jgi:hypothetical protein